MVHIVYIHAPVEDERGLIGRVNEEQGGHQQNPSNAPTLWRASQHSMGFADESIVGNFLPGR